MYIQDDRETTHVRLEKPECHSGGRVPDSLLPSKASTSSIGNADVELPQLAGRLPVEGLSIGF